MKRLSSTTIIAARNAAPYIEQTLCSVLAQIELPDELLLSVDPTSSDATLAIVREFVARPHTKLKVRLIDPVGAGVSAVRNHAIAAATGELISFLAADDLWTPDKLAVQHRYMHEHPEVAFTVTRFRFFIEPGTTRGGFNPALLDRDLDGRIPETLVTRREVFEKVGLFDINMSVGEDVDWFSRAADMGVPMAMIERVMLHKRVHDTNTSGKAATSTPQLMQTLKRSLERKRSGAK